MCRSAYDGLDGVRVWREVTAAHVGAELRLTLDSRRRACYGSEGACLRAVRLSEERCARVWCALWVLEAVSVDC